MSSSKQRRARSKEAKERINESSTTELAANVKVEVNGNANKSIAVTSVRDMTLPSDLKAIEEDESIDVKKSVNSRKSVETADNNSEKGYQR